MSGCAPRSPRTPTSPQAFHLRGDVGVSAIVNELIGRGMAAPAPRERFVQTVSPLDARMDVSNVAEVLETIDGPA